MDEILHELGLAHQKAHRDHAEADPKQQEAFVIEMRKNWMVVENKRK